MVLCFKFQVLTVCNVPFLEALISSPSKVSLGRVDGLKADPFLSSSWHIHSSQPLTTFFLCAFKEVFFGCSSFSTGNSSHFPWDFCFVGSHAQPVFFCKELDLENFGASTDRKHSIPTCFFLTLVFLSSRVLADGGPWGCLGS